jgi:hypothetical protein
VDQKLLSAEWKARYVGSRRTVWQTHSQISRLYLVQLSRLNQGAGFWKQVAYFVLDWCAQGVAVLFNHHGRLPAPFVAQREFAEILTELGWDQESVREVERGVLTVFAPLPVWFFTRQWRGLASGKLIPARSTDTRRDTMSSLFSRAASPAQCPSLRVFSLGTQDASHRPSCDKSPQLKGGCMETSLQLLMRDGAARVMFHPRLTAEQYAELLERVTRASTRDELRKETERAAAKWGKQFEFDTELN